MMFGALDPASHDAGRRGWAADRGPPDRTTTHEAVTPAMVRCLLGIIVLAGLAGGLLLTGPVATSDAVAHAGADLTRLLRFMAVLKSVMAAAAFTGVVWRLGVPVTLPWFAAYALACGAMAAGPGLIWTMAHVGTGALLLHAGLAASILLLWRDQAVARRLAAMIAARAARRSLLGPSNPRQPRARTPA